MRRLWLIFSQAVTVAVAVVFVVATLKPQWWHQAAPAVAGAAVTVFEAPRGPGVAASGQAPGFALAARTAAPAVASVVTSKAAAPQRGGRPNPHQQEPWWPFFFGEPEGPQIGSGSAVIVSPDGYLLTNNHVVEGVDEIEVMLADGRKLMARVVGTDPETDLAVLKVELSGLPAITFAPSDSLQVGDAVLAIGNPFNVGQTVTGGIVSALGRNQLGLNTFENFIQTDAAINPGNSGGALVDAQGLLVGINTAIYSRSGGSMGIGFAIPVSTARQVLEGLVKDGVVTRGWIGVQPRDITPDMVESLKLKADRGVLITGVLQDGPASAAGVRPGDVVQKVGATPVANTAQLLAAVAALKPQARTTLTVRRGADELVLDVQVAQRPRANAVRATEPAPPRR
jgi:Do/DeqQ family serine protease